MCTTCGCSSSKLAPVKNQNIMLEKRILAVNDDYAAQVKAKLNGSNTRAINLLSSPGAGKTTLLEETLKVLQGERALAVIEGDQHTDQDAARIRATGAQAVQINTGKVCHLEAKMIVEALEQMPPLENGLLFIENVGNLICPADFDLGENKKVVLFSVTEGEDKPIKYPHIFHAADLVVISKTDLLPHLRFDQRKAEAYVRQVNPVADIISLSSYDAANEPGFGEWLAWLSAL
ncbi:MAG: hydrogenase nickel incorporation protein HypB [Pseudomonadales bacterium]|nr:hydrogenase nickel incorporation protein HypB [Gammaproteobacteria bacterium]NNL57548.1 hydrogenase nickel incorporation protein HypB [Pseudomonadales bacterium]